MVALHMIVLWQNQSIVSTVRDEMKSRNFSSCCFHYQISKPYYQQSAKP